MNNDKKDPDENREDFGEGFPGEYKSPEIQLQDLEKALEKATVDLDKLEAQRKKQRKDYFKNLGHEGKLADLRDLMIKVFGARSERFRILKETQITKAIIAGKKDGLKPETIQMMAIGTPGSEFFAYAESHWMRLKQGLVSNLFVHYMTFSGEREVTPHEDGRSNHKRIKTLGMDWRSVEALKFWIPQIYEQDLNSIVRKLKPDRLLRVKITFPPTAGGPALSAHIARLKAKGADEDTWIGSIKPRTTYFRIDSETKEPKMFSLGDIKHG